MNTYNVSLLGTEGTGKSCFLAGLYYIGTDPLKGAFTVSPKMDDPIGKQYLTEVVEKLSSGKFPSGTHTMTFLEFEVQIDKDTAMCIKTMDYPGEDFRAGITKSTPEEKIAEFAEHLLKSDIIILLVDPNDIPAEAENSEKRRKIIESINANLQAARNVLNEHKRKGKKKLKRADVCVAVGKFDKLPEFEKAKQAADGGQKIAKRFFYTHWTNFAEKLANNTEIPLKEINFFPISAVGNTVQTEDSSSRDRDGLEPDKDNLAPFGYKELFQWIADRKNRLAWKKFAAICSAAFSAFIVLLVLSIFIFGGKSAVDYETEKNQLALLERQDISAVQKLEGTAGTVFYNVIKRRNEILDDELNRLKEKIENSNDSATLISFRRNVEEVDEVYDGDRNINIENLLKQVSEKLIDIEFQIVVNSFTQRRKTFYDDANAFLNKHQTGPKADEVRKMTAEKEGRDEEEERQRIKNIIVSDSGSLQGKRDAIVNFLETHRGKLNSSDAETMQRAADLAKKFCEQHQYTITLKQYGGFAYQENIQGLVYVDGTVQGSHRSKEKCMTANAGKEFTINWKCGQTIKLEIKAYGGILWGGLEAVASESDNGPAALKMLSQRTQLLPKTKSENGWDWSIPKRQAADGYFMKCEINEISEADWKAFETYIYPGDGW
ncbi:MAG: hypothetical protein FWE67_10645 [Planctomycetaceae bacterium]|nr:hypothetical protein [Planctomycetaceae bacterium]